MNPIGVRFPEEVLIKIKEISKNEDRNFSNTVIRLIKLGIRKLEEDQGNKEILANNKPE